MSDTFTREEAVQAIIEMDTPQPEQDANPAVTDEATAPQAEEEISSDGTTPEDDTSEVTPGDGEDEGEENEPEAEADPIDAPNWWDAEDKEWFRQQSREAQEKLLKQEAKREAITQKFKQQASEAQRQFEAQAKELASLAERAESVFEKAQTAFQSRWDGMTPEVWQELYATDPATAIQLKFEYDTETEQLRQVEQTRLVAQQQAQERHFAEQRQKLQEIAPELSSNPERLQSLGRYIVDSGIPPEAIASATAEELNLVYKAMRYDEMQARAKQAKQTQIATPKPTPQKSLAPSTGREAVLPPQERRVQELKNSLAQTGSRDTLADLFKAGVFG